MALKGAAHLAYIPFSENQSNDKESRIDLARTSLDLLPCTLACPLVSASLLDPYSSRELVNKLRVLATADRKPRMASGLPYTAVFPRHLTMCTSTRCTYLWIDIENLFRALRHLRTTSISSGRHGGDLNEKLSSKLLARSNTSAVCFYLYYILHSHANSPKSRFVLAQ